MAWIDRQWPERDRQYRNKLKAEGRPLPPETPANRRATRVGLAISGITFAVLLLAVIVYAAAR